MTIITSKELAAPRGYSHGVLATGRLLFIAGQIGWNAAGQMVSDNFIGQFDQALGNVLSVVREAGGTAQSIARLTIYVTNKTEYLAEQASIGARYRARMGRHFPAMTLVEVSALLEDGAKVEIEATAIL